MSIIKAGQSRPLAILLYAAVIFHPASFLINKYASTDSFYAPVLLFALACMIILLLKRGDIYRLRYALLTGTVLALLWHIRQENIVILGLLLLYGLIALLTMERRKPPSTVFKELSVTVLVPALLILVVSLMVKTINYVKFGVFAPDAMSAPGFEAAGKALLRIKPMPPVRFVVVPREVRQRAYQVSPAFREIESYMEGNPGRMWASFAKDAGVEVGDEISTGHFWWALNKAAYDVGYNKSARQADQYFQRVADEINAACDEGRLQCRWAFSSVLDPHVQNYLRYLPASFWRIKGVFFQKYGSAREQDPPGLPPEVRAIYDEMANRRTTGNPTDSVTTLSGWAVDPNDSLKGIIVRDRAGRVLAATEKIMPRPDVVSTYAAQGIKVPLNCGYHLEFPSASGQDSSADLVFIAQSGNEWVVPRVQSLSGTATQGSLTYAIEVDNTVVKSFKSRIQDFVGAIYGRITALLTYLSLGSLLVLLICYRYVNPKDKVYMILALLIATLLVRVGLFTLIDASSYFAAGPRYLFPVLYLYTCSLLLVIAQALNMIAARLNHRGILQKIDFKKLYRKQKNC